MRRAVIRRLLKAGRDFGWLLALAASALTYVLLVGGTQVGVSAPGVAPEVKALTPAQLINALDVCLADGAEVSRKVLPSRFEATLLAGDTFYTLTWTDGSPTVAIDDARIGAEPGGRAEPVTLALIECFVTRAQPTEGGR